MAFFYRERGTKAMQTCACERWKQILADYEVPPVEPALDEALQDFIARCRRELSVSLRFNVICLTERACSLRQATRSKIARVP